MPQWHWFKARSPSVQVLLSLPCLTLLVKLSQLASALAATLVVLVLTGFAADSSRVAVFCDELPEVLAGLEVWATVPCSDFFVRWASVLAVVCFLD